MKLKIYIPGGVVLTGDVTTENAQSMADWFKGEGENDIYSLTDNGIQRLIHRKSISIIEFSK